MSKQSDLNDQVLKDKLKILLDEDNETKKWNEGLLIKSLIVLPILIFLIGFFFVSRPANLLEVLFVLTYPLALILIGVIILFFMRNNLD
tara:strand:+ start:352 stop:618 length:267 start_codon:yes stop_codon:yes gene_type:complete